MIRIILTAALALPLGALTVVTGCDREVSSEKSVQVKDDGTKVTHEKSVSETADGGVKKEESKSVDKPDTVKKEETTVKDADGTKKTETTVTH
jgi:hypothetical protein